MFYTMIRRKANWIGHILPTNFLLKHINEWKIEGGIKVTGRQVRRCKLLVRLPKENERISETRCGSTRLHCVKNSL